MSVKDNGEWKQKKVFTTGEAASVCKVSQQTIIRCFDSGRLQGFRVPGSKFRRIPREELIRFMNTNNIPLDAIEGRPNACSSSTTTRRSSSCSWTCWAATRVSR
jgi:excisionase family DNA binding protein